MRSGGRFANPEHDDFRADRRAVVEIDDILDMARQIAKSREGRTSRRLRKKVVLPISNAFSSLFALDRVVPPDHLVRQIDVILDLSWMHKELAPYHSHTGRPSIDPVLMIRMLLVGYVFAIRSERRLCSEVQVNLAYRWFCKLSIEDSIPDHSVFCRARHERFRESEALRRVFEGVVANCIAAGLVGGEALSVEASLIKADVDKKKRMFGDQPIAWPKGEEASRAVREYLAALDNARTDEENDGSDGDDGGSRGGRRRKPPKRSH